MFDFSVLRNAKAYDDWHFFIGFLVCFYFEKFQFLQYDDDSLICSFILGSGWAMYTAWVFRIDSEVLYNLMLKKINLQYVIND